VLFAMGKIRKIVSLTNFKLLAIKCNQNNHQNFDLK